MRVASLVLWLAGCDLALGLSRPLDGPRPVDAAADVAIDAPADIAPIGRDEDLDTIDDVLDNCPDDANTDQLDGDGDDVGDVCDPHPMLPIDRIAYFNGFETAFGPEWIRVSGSWVHAQGVVRQTDLVTGNQLAVLETTFVDPTIQVRASTIADGTHATSQGAVLATDTIASGQFPEGVGCYEIVATSRLGLFENRTVPGTGTSNAVRIGNWPMRIALQASTQSGAAPDGPVACVASYTGIARSTFTMQEPAPIATARVALYSYNGRATFHAVTVYDRKP